MPPRKTLKQEADERSRAGVVRKYTYDGYFQLPTKHANGSQNFNHYWPSSTPTTKQKPRLLRRRTTANIGHLNYKRKSNAEKHTKLSRLHFL